MPLTTDLAAKETGMFGAMDDQRYAPREPHTLPEAHLRWENSHGTEAHIRRIEDAWALHAMRANGFGGVDAYAGADG